MRLCSGLFELYFLKGIKRVCLNHPHFEKFEIMKNNYPFINQSIFPALDPIDFIFFQNEQLKQNALETYLQNAEAIQPDTYEFHKILGSILEFPPKAVEFFASGRVDREPSLGIHYCGNSFTSSLDDVFDNVAWMWKRFPYPEDDTLIIKFEMDFVEIPFEDFELLRKIESNLKRIKGELHNEKSNLLRP